MVMEIQDMEAMSSYVEALVTSGNKVLDESVLKKLKKICKKGDEHVSHTYKQILSWLERDQSQIRYSCVLLADQLFMRSHCFRDILLAEFQCFMELTLGIDVHQPLPPPKETSKLLKVKTIHVIQAWNDKFGAVYKKLSLGYNFLKTCKKINFEEVTAQTEAERRQEEERQSRMAAFKQDRINSVNTQLTEMEAELNDTLTQTDTCLTLLLPDPEEFSINCIETQKHSENTASVITKDQLKNPCEHSTIVKQEKITPSCVVATPNTCTVKSDPVAQSTEICDRVDLSKVKVETDESKQDEANYARKTEVRMNTGVVRGSDGPGNTLHSTAEQQNDTCSHQLFSDEDDGNINGLAFTGELKQEHEEEDDYSQTCELAREHGLLHSQDFSIEVSITPGRIEIEETEDNTDILHNLRDLRTLITQKYLPLVTKWLQVLTKNNAEEDRIKHVLNIKHKLEVRRDKVGELGVTAICKSTKRSPRKEDESDEDDFEDVPEKEGYEATVPEHLQTEFEKHPNQGKCSSSHAKYSRNRDWSLSAITASTSQGDAEKDPTCWLSTVNKIAQSIKQQEKMEGATSINLQSSTSRTTHPQPSTSVQSDVDTEGMKHKHGLLAPVIPYNTDLYHWQDENPVTPMVVQYEHAHRFWARPADDGEIIDKAALEAMRTRVINFTGQFEPVRWSCRAPLPSGKLCPRMDRFKCPFHGRIIARNDKGEPENAEDRKRLNKEEEKRKQDAVPEWQDPELLREIKAATGHDLSWKGKRRGKGKGKKEPQHPGLIDVSKKHNSVNDRLEKKLFNKATMKRVTAALDAISAKRARDKFGNSFNYCHTK